MELEQALLKGINAHKAGDLEKANSYYSSVLQSQPAHPEANHNMGILATTSGQNSEAMFFFKKAVEVKPDFLQYWISYILILIELRQSEDAEKALLEAKKKGLDDSSVQELNNRILRISNAEEKPKSSKGIENVIELYNQGKLEESLKQARKYLPRTLIPLTCSMLSVL